MKVHIRFLIPGLIEAQAPDNFAEMSPQEKLDWAHEALNRKTDRELLNAVAQHEEPETYGWFDEAPAVSAIEAAGGNIGEIMVETDEWRLFASGEGLKTADM